eukprot:172589-Rhodomonas_salina.1
MCIRDRQIDTGACAQPSIFGDRCMSAILLRYVPLSSYNMVLQTWYHQPTHCIVLSAILLRQRRALPGWPSGTISLGDVWS